MLLSGEMLTYLLLWSYPLGLTAATWRGTKLALSRDVQKNSTGILIPDPDPLIVNFSLSLPSTLANQTVGLAGGYSTWPSNPKNGTPWYRLKKKDGRGQASHEHFGGLSAAGDFKVDIVDSHNVVRKRVGIRSLKWNEGLELIAARRVQLLVDGGCYIQHSPLHTRWEESGFQYIGENLYKVINMVPTGVDVADAWYAEISDYRYGKVGDACTKKCLHRSSPPCTLGHFTQLMWSGSSDIGCARAECPGTPQRTFIVVCNYGEGGNIVGEFPFQTSNSVSLGLAGEECSSRTAAELQEPTLAQGHGNLHGSTVRATFPICFILVFPLVLMLALSL